MLIFKLTNIICFTVSESEFLYRDKNTNKDVFLTPDPKKNQLTSPELETEFKAKTDAQKKLLNEHLGLKDKNQLNSYTDKDFWEKILDYIKLNLKDFLVDGRIGIGFEIRYALCCYIVLQIPAEVGFFFPKNIFNFIPEKFLKFKYINDFISEAKMFLDFIKQDSEGKLMISAVFGRKEALFEDIRKCIYAIRDIRSDTRKSVDTLLAFEMRAPGYQEYKREKKGKQDL